MQRLAALTQSFESEIRLKSGGNETVVNGVFSLMPLALAPGAEVEICAEGPDARQGAHTLQVLLANGTLLGYGENDRGEGEVPPWCAELASIVRAFDSRVIVEEGHTCADAGDAGKVAELRSNPDAHWRVRATGPDAPRAREVVQILLDWLGRKAPDSDSKGTLVDLSSPEANPAAS
jgi:phosphotransferase system HPr-like phosphotransfer protein